jgi:hypothetical protein
LPEWFCVASDVILNCDTDEYGVAGILTFICMSLCGDITCVLLNADSDVLVDYRLSSEEFLYSILA